MTGDTNTSVGKQVAFSLVLNCLQGVEKRDHKDQRDQKACRWEEQPLSVIESQILLLFCRHLFLGHKSIIPALQ